MAITSTTPLFVPEVIMRLRKYSLWVGNGHISLRLILLPSNLILYVHLQSRSDCVHWSACDDNHMRVCAGDKLNDVDKKGWKETAHSEGWKASYVVIRTIDGTCTVVIEPLIITRFPSSILMQSTDLIVLPNGALTAILAHLHSIRISCLSWRNCSQFLLITGYPSLEHVREVCKSAV